MLLFFLILSPLIGVLALTLVTPDSVKTSRFIAGMSAFFTFFLSLILLRDFLVGSIDQNGFFEYFEFNWIRSIKVRAAYGVDSLSVALIVLTTFLTSLVCLASASITKKIRSYLACILLLEVGMLGALMALDGISFYVFWELMLIPMYFLIGIWGGDRRIYATIKFVLYTVIGSLPMLVAIVYLAYLHQQQYQHFSFLLNDWKTLTLDTNVELILFSAMALAFAIKVPVFPLHTWLPDAHVQAPTGGSVILAGVLLKMGLYGLIRFAIPVFPNAVVETAHIFAILGVIGIVFGALVAWVQTDIKKLVAYSSVSHLGFCVLGYASLNLYGMQGCVLQMINHGISTGALFFLVGVLYDRKHTREISNYGGLASKVPVFSFMFLIFTLSSIGLPLTNGFVGEFLLLLSAFKFNKIIAAIGVSGVILGAMYMLSLYRRVVFGEFDKEKNGDLKDLNSSELAILFSLAVLVFAIGLFPQYILKFTESSSKKAISYLEESRDGIALSVHNVNGNKKEVRL